MPVLSRPRPALAALVITAAIGSTIAPDRADAQYRQPPAPIADILDKPATPQVQVSPDRTRLLLLERPGLPSIAAIAAPEYRIAGIRFDPANFGPSRRFGATGLALQPVSGGAARPISMSLPPKSTVGNVSWSVDGQRIAFTVSSPDAITLWLADATSGIAKQLTPRKLNAVLNTPCSWASAAQLVCAFVPENRGGAPVAPTTPDGPIVQEALSGSTDRAATYQDLLKTPFDEKAFEYYGTSQLALVSTDGTVRPLGKSGLHASARVSPDGKFVLVNTLSRPFSYTVPWSYFPTRTEVWSLDGTPVKTVHARPLVEKVPWGGNGALVGPRNVTWRSDSPATLVWTEALDNGDQNAKVPKRDKIVALAAPFTGSPTTLLETEYRAGGILWATPSMAIATETDGKTLRTRTWMINPTGAGAPRMLWDRSAEDRYGNPGTFLTTRDPRGQTVLRTTPDGRSAFLVSEGASAEGDRPFVDKYDLATGKTTRLFRSEAPYYESVIDLLDPAGNVALTRRESKTEPPNYFARDLVRRIAPRALTSFADPAPQFAGMTSQLISYTRKDGVKLSATIHLPAGYDKGRDGPLPFLLWAYPLEFRSQDAASQVVGSPYRFVRPNGDSHLFLLTQGYGVMDNPTMPIVGGEGKEPNDTYVEQLTASAQAAVDTIVAMGVADRERIGVGGHSYGAFMTANLLAHTRLFKAGVARSGAYNRTLTPFGFQGEERSYWEAPDLYERMSPFTHANKIKDPILLIHGMADNNTGTYPIQSERMYQALKGHGATVRYVQLPAESHGYSARESVGHSLSEMVSWLDQYVKGRKKAAM